MNKLPPYMGYLKHIYDKDFKKILSQIKNPIKVGTDCSGIDAPIHALKIMNIPFVYKFASDINAHAKQSIMCNHPPEIFFDDITKRKHKSLPGLDLYFAGFPCQAFSTLGKRQGFDDDKNRGKIFFHCYETIKQTKPYAFVLENVNGLLNHDEGRTFQTIMKCLNRLKGYHISYEVLNTADYGIPHSRRRVYIVGIKGQQFNFPQPIKLKITVRDLLDNNKNIKDPFYFEITDHKYNVLHDLVKYGVIDSLDNDWIVNLNVSTYKWSGAKKDISPCLLSSNGSNCIFFITSEKRKLTENEYVRLQGFPPSFKICVSRAKTYQQIGNTMSVNVLCFLIKNIVLT